MSNPLYDRLQQTASKLLTSYGQDITVFRLQNSYDAVLGTNWVAAFSVTLKGTVQKPSAGGSNYSERLSQLLLQDKVKKVNIERFVPYEDFQAITTGDLCYFEGSYWVIEEMNTVSPGGVAVVVSFLVVKVTPNAGQLDAIGEAQPWNNNGFLVDETSTLITDELGQYIRL